ncbi:hypothetical protein SPAN111604_10855 [Sphingomonas antarctica]|uniref:hypothetical protein n=1 Tax=Sphingomonas antarctica TaxID=2040274 RepID=UPI0039ECBCC0
MLRRLTAFMAVLAAFASPAAAANIEWTTTTQYSTTPMQNTSSGTDAGVHLDARSYGQAYVALQPSPYPAIVASAFVNPTGYTYESGLAVAQGTLRYDYTYTAASLAERSAIIDYAQSLCVGQPGCNLFNAPLVTISGREFTSSGPNGHAEVDIYTGAIGPGANLECIRGNGGCGLRQFTINGALMATSGLDFRGTLELTAFARADGGSYYCYYPQTPGACDRAEAWVDPVISLNSGFAWSSPLVLTPGFANAAGPAGGPVIGAGGVPEQAQWAMMIGGFGFAGATRRSMRRRAAALA